MIGSRTLGTVTINMGNAVISCRFNKSSKNDFGIMEVKDMKGLQDELLDRLDKGKLTPEQCLDLLHSLADVESKYGNICLIAEDCMFTSELVRTAKKAIEKRK